MTKHPVTHWKRDIEGSRCVLGSHENGGKPLACLLLLRYHGDDEHCWLWYVLFMLTKATINISSIKLKTSMYYSVLVFATWPYSTIKCNAIAIILREKNCNILRSLLLNSNMLYCIYILRHIVICWCTLFKELLLRIIQNTGTYNANCICFFIIYLIQKCLTCWIVTNYIVSYIFLSSALLIVNYISAFIVFF